MERMEEYQRMREEEAGRPVPAELACLETRVRARAAERPRRRRGPVLAAVCLCLVLGTGMAWGMGGFAALDRLLGENAGQLIEDEELRAQIKGSGIGTSATRAEILKKLIHIKYLSLNKKTQIITPTLQGEMVYDVVNQSIRSLLNPELTASWEKGLTYVADGEITPDEYMQKLDHFIISRTEGVKRLNNQYQLKGFYDAAAKYYKKPVSSNRTSRKKEN